MLRNGSPPRWRGRAGLVAVVVLTGILTSAELKPAAGADPVYLGWSGLLPPLPAAYAPAEAAECANGGHACVTSTIETMREQFTTLAEACDHRAVFALAYLRTTEEYQRVASEPGFFQDVAYVNTEDAVFAAYYFRAYDAWNAGDRSAVPQAWSIAFGAAANGQLTGVGDLLLGMNAHVNRDLPYVLASLGLVAADGRSGKPDHDKINLMLNRVVDPLLHEAADRFDPSIDDLDTPYGLSWTVLMQVLVTWREGAWRNAELLVNAPSDAARELVASQIESVAAATAITLRSLYREPSLVPAGPDRDSYCASRA